PACGDEGGAGGRGGCDDVDMGRLSFGTSSIETGNSRLAGNACFSAPLLTPPKSTRRYSRQSKGITFPDEPEFRLSITPHTPSLCQKDIRLKEMSFEFRVSSFPFRPRT